MGRAPCCDKLLGLKKGPWTREEDEILVSYISKHGIGSWRSLPKLAGLLRCGKSCRLRWTNYLRPDIKRGPFTEEEEKLVIQLHALLGNKWAAIASQLPGRTDNEVKNLWNIQLKKRLISMGLDPLTHEPISAASRLAGNLSKSKSANHMAQWENARLEAEARLSKELLLFVPTPTQPSTDSDDYFLRMWHSEVGESFRNFSGRGETSAISRVSSTKGESVSGTTVEAALTEGKASNLESSTQTEEKNGGSSCKELAAESDSSSSNGLEDSVGTALQLLFDYPVNNDMSFLGLTDDFLSGDND